MEENKLLIRITILIVSIFIVNFFAMKFHWYNSLWYFDMFMHFIGGFWLGLVLFFLLKTGEYSVHNVLVVLFGVLAVSLLWEVFEIVVNYTTTKDMFNFADTFSDLFFDLSGAFLANIYFFSRILKNSL